MNLTFRETQIEDLEAVFSVRARTRQNPISKAGLAQYYGITPASTAADMESGKLKSWSCFDGDTLVGFGTGDRTTGEVIVMAVLPNYEGKGIGKRLLAQIVAWLQSVGFAQPWLAASPNPSIRAYGFYRALGWEPTGRTLENGDQILVFKARQKLSSQRQEVAD